MVVVAGGSWSQVKRARFGDLKNGGEEINASDLRANRGWPSEFFGGDLLTVDTNGGR